MWDGNVFADFMEPETPYPSNMPTNSNNGSHRDSGYVADADDDSSFLFRSLRLNQHWTSTDRPGLDLLAMRPEALQGVPQVRVSYGQSEFGVCKRVLQALSSTSQETSGYVQSY